ncbi:MAG: hypothetical protein NTY09_06140 [bacterium]|nr:hypothetical protein [bacterium]
MVKTRLAWVIGIILLLLAVAAVQVIAAGRGSHDTGATFTMVMEVPGQDTAEFSGMAFGENSRLEGQIGGIDSVKLLSGGKLYILTPAIKTAREMDNPDTPGSTSDSWLDWLSEPGRINPLTFASAIGQPDDVSDTIELGQGGRVTVVFEDGILNSIRFPNSDGDGMVAYTYRNFEDDSDLTASDFQVPGDYLMTD